MGMPFVISRMLAAVFAVTLLAGCAAVTSEVSRFNELPKDVGGSAFYVMPLKWQEGSAEYSHYADSLTKRLEAKGFRRTASFPESDYVLTFDYGTKGSREVTGSSPVWGQTGGGTTTYHSGTVSAYGSQGYYSGQSYTAPTYGITGYTPYSYTVHDRFFRLSLIDVNRSTPVNPVAAYEASVSSSGSSANFSTVSECIFDAVFKNFFRTGSETVEIASSECMK